MINIAIKEAGKSTFERARMGAVLYRGRKVLGKGFNVANRFQSKVRTTSYFNSIHAEVAACIDALHRYPPKDLKGTTILVVRLGRTDELKLALPCKHCYRVLKNMGIKKVKFTTDSAEVNEIKL